MPRQCNQAAVTLLKTLEGLRLRSYKDQRGILTIGYGHTGDVFDGQNITNEQADDLLRKDLNRFEAGVECMVHTPLTDNQFSALCLFTFNIGLGEFKDSHCLLYLNQSKFKVAADAMLLFDKVTINGVKTVVEHQVDRRNAERNLFLKPDNV